MNNVSVSLNVAISSFQVLLPGLQAVCFQQGLRGQLRCAEGDRLMEKFLLARKNKIYTE